VAQRRGLLVRILPLVTLAALEVRDRVAFGRISGAASRRGTKGLIGDKGYDADWLRDELKARGVRVCIPPRRKRKRPAHHNRKLYKKRCRIEIAFTRLKDWRGIAIRYTRCGALFLSAIALAAAVIFWLPL
jgi:transposase